MVIGWVLMSALRPRRDGGLWCGRGGQRGDCESRTAFQRHLHGPAWARLPAAVASPQITGKTTRFFSGEISGFGFSAASPHFLQVSAMFPSHFLPGSHQTLNYQIMVFGGLNVAAAQME